jgi:sugar phosphate isomerase/epimerase
LAALGLYNKRMALGIVSNCWRVQLDEHESIDRLIAEALRRRYHSIELRQGCLGRYERGADRMPDADALAELPRRFPEATLNIAIAFPFGSALTTHDEKLFHRLFLTGVDAAVAVAGPGKAYLRLVDVTTTAEQAVPNTALDTAALDTAANVTAARLASLADSLVRRGGLLAIENARQPWQWTLDVLRGAKRKLGDDSRCLRLCYDPCNLLMAPDVTNCGDATRSLAADDLAAVHAKQQHAGRILPTVADGDVDWAEQVTALTTMDYQGPILFEVAPEKAIWENLEASRLYLAV